MDLSVSPETCESLRGRSVAVLGVGFPSETCMWELLCSGLAGCQLESCKCLALVELGEARNRKSCYPGFAGFQLENCNWTPFANLDGVHL
jgi:hypothetical protein